MNQGKKILKTCPNCGETNDWCACMRNTCIKCGKPVGNITFTVCDDCWDKDFTPNNQMNSDLDYATLHPGRLSARYH